MTRWPNHFKNMLFFFPPYHEKHPPLKKRQKPQNICPMRHAHGANSTISWQVVDEDPA